MTFKSCFIPVNEIFELTEVENTSVNSIVVLVNAMWKHYLKALFLFLVLEENNFYVITAAYKTVPSVSPL